MAMDDKLGLFFNDYSFVPLFVQENYLLTNPMQARYVLLFQPYLLIIAHSFFHYTLMPLLSLCRILEYILRS